jgi:hypothetical protein
LLGSCSSSVVGVLFPGAPVVGGGPPSLAPVDTVAEVVSMEGLAAPVACIGERDRSAPARAFKKAIARLHSSLCGHISCAYLLGSRLFTVSASMLRAMRSLIVPIMLAGIVTSVWNRKPRVMVMRLIFPET